MPATDPMATYPNLMRYIHDRNTLGSAADWCEQLREDEAKAVEGGFAAVAYDLDQAQADYAAQERAQGREGYPYNQAMGEFLGLPMAPGKPEPEHGYYMACGVRSSYAFGLARRHVEDLIRRNKPLRIVAARSKATREPTRFFTFAGPDQIRINGTGVVASNGKRRVTLSSNWSTETCLQKVATAMQTGQYYGQDKPVESLFKIIVNGGE